MELTITRRDLTSYTVRIKKGELSQKLLNEDVVSLSVTSPTPISFMLGDTISVFGSRYILNRLPKVRKEGIYTYDLEFEGEMYALRRAQFLLYDDTGVAIEGEFSYMGNMEDVARLAISNLNRVYGNGTYVLGSFPNTEVRNHVISSENVLAVLQRICSDYGYEFELIYSGGVTTLNIGSVGSVKLIALKYGAGKGLYQLERQLVDDANIFTRLFAYGSTRNLKSTYRNFSKRLKLPNNDQSFIQDNDAINSLGVIEATKIFDDIYPRRTGVITSVSGINSFIDTTMDFDLNATDGQGQSLYLIPGNLPKVHFNTGNLAGYEFEITSYNHSTKSFTLKYYQDERGMRLPSNDAAFALTVGDEYVLLDIIMPQSYVDAAEAELQSKATELLSQGKSPKAKYACAIDPIYAKQNELTLKPGDYIPLQDDELGINRDFRVLSVKRDMIEPYRWSIELGDEVTVSLATYLVENTIAHEKIININQLKDPSRYRQNWRTTMELQQMVFDQDGYFDSGNIRPLSINTAMLSVGSKAGQFVLNGVVFQPGYNGEPNRIVNTLGTLSHYAIEDNIRTWYIEAYDYTVPDNEARYIYIECDVNGNSAQVEYRTDQLKVDAESGYYYFLVGVLHSVQDGYRKISLTYGATTINGKEIKTGRITSQDGQTYFDLDAGEIKGKIVFRSGLDDSQIEQEIDTAQSTADTAQTTANNAQSTANSALSTANNAATQAAAIAPDDSSLKLRYRFDGDSLSVAADESGNRVNGTIQGTKGTNWDWDLGKKGKGFKTISDAGGITVAGTSETTKRGYFKNQAFTISAWFKILVKPSGANYYAVAFDFPYYNTHTSPYFCSHLEVVYDYVNDKVFIRFQYNLSGTAKNITYTANWSDIGLNWHHIAIVYASGQQKLYLDGVLVASDTQSGTITYTDNGIIRVASGNSGYNKMANWVLDELRYDARILTDSEILGLYKGLGDASSKTTIDGGVITTGNIILRGSDNNEKAGITAEGGETSVRIWAGDTYANRAGAPFRALQDGTVYATKGFIGGWSLQDDSGGTKLFKSGANKFYIDADNQMIAVKDSSNNDKLLFQAQNLPLLSALQATSANNNFTTSDTSFTGTNTLTVTMTPTVTPSYDGNMTVRAYVQYTANAQAGRVDFGLTLTANLYDSAGSTFIKTLGSASMRIFTSSNQLLTITGSLPSGAGGVTYTVKFDIVATDNSVIDPEFNRTPAPGTCVIDWSNPNSQYSYTFTYSRALTIIATNGIASYWASNKYFYLSSSDASYFLQFKGNAILYAPSGSAYYQLTDSNVRMQYSSTRYFEITSSQITLMGIPSGSDVSGDWGYVKVQPSTGKIYYKTS